MIDHRLADGLAINQDVAVRLAAASRRLADVSAKMADSYQRAADIGAKAQRVKGRDAASLAKIQTLAGRQVARLKQAHDAMLQVPALVEDVNALLRDAALPGS